MTVKKNIKEIEYKSVRNATRTCIAPTGSISIIAGASSGIEPLFALVLKRTGQAGMNMTEVHPLLLEAIKKNVISTKSNKNLDISDKINLLPDDIKKIFITAQEVSLEWHIKMQAAFQKHVNLAVSKTINMPNSATKEDIYNAYFMSWKMGNKGITIYRDGSRSVQVLSKVTKEEFKKEIDQEIDSMNQDNCIEVASKIINMVESENRREAITELSTGIGEKKIEKVVDYTSTTNDRSNTEHRDPVMEGKTHRKQTGCGYIYITVNRKIGETNKLKVREVFVQLGKNGGCAGAHLEATCRLASTALKGGVSVRDVIRQLRAIRCPSPAGFGDQQILSCCDAIAKVLLEEIGEAKTYKNFDDQKLEKYITPAVNTDGVCPECGEVLAREEGCLNCHTPGCGYSRCN